MSATETMENVRGLLARHYATFAGGGASLPDDVWRRGKSNRLPDWLREVVAHRYAAGEKPERLARLLEIPAPSIRLIARQAGVSRRPGRPRAA